MDPINILYLCDGKQCYNGPCQNEDCHHTHDINHALHKDDLDGKLFEYFEYSADGKICFIEVESEEG